MDRIQSPSARRHMELGRALCLPEAEFINKEVTPVSDTEIEEVYNALITAFDKCEGHVAGIAATQLGIQKSAFVIKDVCSGKPIFVANPTVKETAKMFHKSEQGCLSTGDAIYSMYVPNHYVVTYINENKESVTTKFSHDMADRFHHECLHIRNITLSSRGKVVGRIR